MDRTASFDPALVRIKPCDTIHFIAVDKGRDVHSVQGMTPAKAEPFNASLGQETFVEPGFYLFACPPHTAMGMVGVVAVGDLGNIDEINPSSPAKAKSKIEALLARVRNGS